MKVYINSKDHTKPRQLVDVEVISESKNSFKVRLPDGNIIVRKKSRDLPTEGMEKKGNKE